MYFVEKIKGKNYLKFFDLPLFAAVLALTIIGMIVLGSAVRAMENPQYYISRQTAGIIIGIIAALVIAFIDYGDLRTLGIFFYIGCAALLVAVLFIGTGEQEWGSRSWIYFSFIRLSIQPSEFAKIAFIILSSMFLERISEGMDIKFNILKLTVYSGLVIFLIMMQPDLGTAMVFIFIFIVLVFVSGIKYRYIAAAFLSFAAFSPLAWLFVLKDHQKQRILTFLFPASASASDEAFQLIRSIMAIGSGQIFGKGLFRGIQTQNNRVPVKESDFIYTVIGEELGFAGSILILAIIFFILLKCIYIARTAADRYGSYLAAGVAALYGFHFTENIGMCLGLLPITGIPLPFISYGATAMITNYMALGIVMSVSMRRNMTFFGGKAGQLQNSSVKGF
ncbi:MAG: FtsW/RodA/SpoVE family cell cycle protein [Eubacteriales bacterium]|nr:FtsW/RodA/SpoVE family cell cycle protein [Eubacteriales bacterium]